MANRLSMKKTQKTQKPKSREPNALQQQTLNRLLAFDAVLSPFWSARSGYGPLKSGQP